MKKKYRFFSNLDREMKNWEWCIANLEIQDIQQRNMMQYTGLKDKNGKEIFEGDVCRNGDWDSNANSEIYREEVVEWVEEEACFRGFYFNHEGMTCEVIGNVYENPELRTNKKIC